jgi:hypothetical protein
MKSLKTFALLAVIVAAIALSIVAVYAQTSTTWQSASTIATPTIVDSNNKNLSHGDLVTFSPTQLNFNAAVLPASNVSADTNIINTARFNKLTVMGNCGQIWTLRVNVYDETGTVLLNTFDAVSSIPASVWHQFYFASEIVPNATGGTVTATTNFRLPQRAISFRAFNTTATPSTCTLRAFGAVGT